MAKDGNRIYPIVYGIIHHAVTPKYTNYTDRQIRDIFDNFGKKIYSDNGQKPVGHIHPDTGKLTHTQAHYALHPYTSDKNKYGYRMVKLLNDPNDNVVWGAGNWPVNQQAINIECCMDARNEVLPEKALMLIADTLRPLDKKAGGKLNVLGHSQVSQLGTQCPARLLGQMKTIIDMINNPDKWNKKLFPAPKPAPKPTPKPTPAPANPYKRFEKPLMLVTNKAPTNLYNITKKTWDDLATGVVKKLGKGEEFQAVGQYAHPLGGVYYMTSYSFGDADKTGKPTQPNGVNKVDLSPKPAAPTPPAPTTPTTPAPVDPNTPPATVEEAVKDPSLLTKLLAWILARLGKKS